VQAQAAAARLPLRPVRMIVQALYERPGLAGIIRSKQSCWLDAAIERIWFVVIAWHNLPDLF
jgi:hypothetical protein